MTTPFKLAGALVYPGLRILPATSKGWKCYRLYHEPGVPCARRDRAGLCEGHIVTQKMYEQLAERLEDYNAPG